MTGAFITCRLASTRLPQKHLLSAKGKPMIEHLIDRIKRATKIDKIYICTTINPEDSIFREIALKNNIGYFFGSEEDIIKRHLDCALQNEIDLIVNIDGDDIFCDPEFVDQVVSIFESDSEAEVVKTEGLPFGINSMGYKRDVLLKIIKTRGKDISDTGWGEYFNNPSLFHIKKVSAPEAFRRDFIRATLDYEDDYEFFKTVIEELYMPHRQFTLMEMIQLVDEKPWIAKINNHLYEEYWKNYNQKSMIQSNQ